MRSIEREIVGAFIVSRDNKLLLGKSRKGGVYAGAWIVPGGGIETSETEVAALIRETQEETGIDVSEEHIEKVTGALDGESVKILRDTGETVLVKMHFSNYKISLDQDSKDVVVTCDDDFIDAQWFGFDELKQLELSPPTRETLKVLGLLD